MFFHNSNMLVKEVISIGAKIRVTIPRLRTSIETYSKSYGSSSDSSSDSDSDAKCVQKLKQSEQHETIQDKSTKVSLLDGIIDKMIQKKNKTSRMGIAISPKQTTPKEKLHKKQNLSYEAQLTEAADNVTNILKGDKKEIKIELLERLSHMNKDNKKNEKQNNLKKIITIMGTENQKAKTSIIYELKLQEEKNKRRKQYQTKEDWKKIRQEEKGQDLKQTPTSSLFNIQNNMIFKKIKEPKTVIPELPVWKSLQERELALLSNQSPQNVFQEMIQWTDSGKLWKFPIDNEYGMEQEHNVHFSEHVFLERHLKDWCPKLGPIRHFMELVCVGLSKNPYMTVEEKIEHITWYKDYFKGKEEILMEIGAINVSSSTKEEIKT